MAYIESMELDKQESYQEKTQEASDLAWSTQPWWADWWRGRRGEWWVIVQFTLLPLHFAGPLLWGPGPAAWGPAFLGTGRWIGLVLALPGLVFALAGAGFLGSNLSALPQPKDDSRLVTSGPYRWVRHPIYSGLVFLAFAWAILWEAPLPLLGALVLAVFFRLKAHQEEKRLVRRYAEYPAYRQRTKALIPGLW